MNIQNNHATQFLAQILVRYMAEKTPIFCQSIAHKKVKPVLYAKWKLHFYQDLDRMLSQVKQGMTEAEVNQLAWDETCKEQDERGLVTHKLLYLCSACAYQLAELHGGRIQATLAMSTTTATGGSFLLVSDRRTESTAIVCNISANLDDYEIYNQLQQSSGEDIHFKPADKRRKVQS